MTTSGTQNDAPRRWVALLRGVNVGGVTIRSAPLADVFRALGFDDVKTVLASGNVLFTTTEDDGSALTGRIEKALTDEFGYSARVVLVRQSTLADVVTAYPFDEVDDRQPYVIFASDPMIFGGVDLADLDESIERVASGDDVLYWEVRRGLSTDSTFSKRTAKAKSTAVTTTRNLRTLRKLL
ncbi:DUF1697 domain-containing protein [Mycetocola zhujimingii]|uniref:DUF1697 domain-containing protein n=1 Tax=Mycetocola zhujimingii TaxID=2079792 RepID=A0A2U1TCX9_9MICO|nr:DUF1697 domain-containing protein [Mycetocola zhujimingii]AWB87241.1 pyridoxamine 5-phosphate oxidase [Mycetocola zhujimingii]PWC06748.1 DUF1697 domain-containing protein [Mycetocola zhujimingii]